MKTTHLLFLCILGAALVSTVVCHSAPAPKACCFEFYSKKVRKELVKSYYITDQRCAKVGAILKTQRARICVNPAVPWVEKTEEATKFSSDGINLVTKKCICICVDPSLSWVQRIMKYVDQFSCLEKTYS
ncbi:eotaxin-like [Channa argus]|uniref:eotaxin-like n=1 Tax=Channa argus TaxID=215402 RepID=UPI003520DB4C